MTVVRSAVASLLVLVPLAGPAAGQPASLAVLDVPFLSQSEALCGGAAAAMVMRYWGERGVNAESFSHLIDQRAGGIRATALVSELVGRGWDVVAARGTEALIGTHLDRGRPVIALIEDRPGAFHYVVVVAATPGAVVFHDPARAAYRVSTRAGFAARWDEADRWMAIVVPSARPDEATTPAPASFVAGGSCDEGLAAGVRYAQVGAFDAAERSLTAALSCGAAPLRELAGLRLLQRRWPEVRELAAEAVRIDPDDAHAWDLLATSRFVQDDAAGALEAWNRIGRPRIDLVAVDGLTRTRQRVVERLLDVPADSLLTPRLFVVTDRRLQELPSASGTRLEFVPVASGLAELRAHVVERPLLPAGAWHYAGLGAVAAARSEVSLSTGAFTGGGERLNAAWRFWPHRHRVSAEYVAPSPWGGVWGVEAFSEQEAFAGAALPPARRAGATLTASHWIGPWARVSVRGGTDWWRGLGRYGAAAGALTLASSDDRLVLDVTGSGWAGRNPFGSATVEGRGRSSRDERGRVYLARVGMAWATPGTPADIWFAGDTGRTRAIPLRGHPLVKEGGLQLEQLGRRMVHGSVEVRQWWSQAPLVRLGAAAFADSARVDRRMASGSRADLDVGVGARVVAPGFLDGVFRVDLARGLRDGSMALSFVYEP